MDDEHLLSLIACQRENRELKETVRVLRNKLAAHHAEASQALDNQRRLAQREAETLQDTVRALRERLDERTADQGLPSPSPAPSPDGTLAMGSGAPDEPKPDLRRTRGEGMSPATTTKDGAACRHPVPTLDDQGAALAEIRLLKQTIQALRSQLDSATNAASLNLQTIECSHRQRCVELEETIQVLRSYLEASSRSTLRS